MMVNSAGPSDHEEGDDENPKSTTLVLQLSPSKKYQRQQPPRRKVEANLLQKLRSREISGSPRRNVPSGNRRDPSVRFFSRLPGRLAFCLRDVIPYGAIESGHVFLGFSKCGQFLLSYTQTEVDIDLMTLVSTHLTYQYRLQWWLFVPYARARKVAEVILFNDASAAGNLHISFCQWPRDDTAKVLVFGCQVNDETISRSSARPCYITVTAIPSLRACKDCISSSCLQHGMTVHTTFDLVPPYPNFEPRISMKRDSGVVVNSGNILHFLSFELLMEESATAAKKAMPPTPSPPVIPSTSSGRSRIIYSSPLNAPDNSDCESEASSWSSFNRKKMNPGRIERVTEFVEQLSPRPRRQRQQLPGEDWDLLQKQMAVAADNVLMVTEDNFEAEVQENPGMSSVDLSTLGCSQASPLKDNSDCESETSSWSYMKKKKMNPERMEKVAEFVQQLSPHLKRQQLTQKKDRSKEEKDHHRIEKPMAAAAKKAVKLTNEGNEEKLTVSTAANSSTPGFTQDSPPHSSDVESEASLWLCNKSKKVNSGRVAEFVKQMSPHMQRQLPQNRCLKGGVLVYGMDEEEKVVNAQNGLQKRMAAAAEKVFELTDENFEEGVREKLSTFRKRRLADKRYEFTDDDLENVTPPLLLRSSKVVELEASDQEESEEEMQKLHSNQIDLVPPAEVLSSPGGGTMVKKTQYKFHAKFTRRYVEMGDEDEQEMTSASGERGGGAELLDDDCEYQGYHSALPLQVHGSAYQSMAAISTSSRLRNVLKVRQSSLDVELFCHDMAQKLCAAAGKNYWFCNDYDVELVDMDPDTGDVICIAVVLVTATFVTHQRQQMNAATALQQRHLHQGELKFCWNVDSGECRLIDSEPLEELFKEPHGVWHPARNISTTLQKTWAVLGPNSGAGNIRCFTNDSVIRGTSLKTIVDPDHLVAIILDDLEN